MSNPGLSARELILTLTDSTRAEALSAAYLIAAGELFDLDAGAIRVALARLVRDGALVQPQRGLYSPGSRAELAPLLRGWSALESRTRPWTGSWLVAYLGHAGRSNKSRVRSRERALRLTGFAAVDARFWVRPANLAISAPALRQQLLDLGLDPAATLLHDAAVEPACTFDPDRLWPRAPLEASYREHIDTLERSERRLAELGESAAARETLLIGRAVTRAILLDPLLPRELVDTALRKRMVDTMRAYDRLGKRLWRRFYARCGRDGN